METKFNCKRWLKLSVLCLSIALIMANLPKVYAQQGISCSNPVVVGTDTSITGSIWYKYILAGNGTEKREVIIESNMNSLSFYKNCGIPWLQGSIKFGDDGYTLYTLQGMGGSTLFIKSNEEGNNFKITDIAAVAQQAGVAPVTAAELYLGKNSFVTGAYAEIWGKFTFPEDGSVSIETNSQYAVLYNAIPSYINHRWMDFQNYLQPEVLHFSSSHYNMMNAFKTVVSANGKKGQTIYLRMFNDYVTPDMLEAKLKFNKKFATEGTTSANPIVVKLNEQTTIPLLNHFEFLEYSFIAIDFLQSGKYKISANKSVDVASVDDKEIYVMNNNKEAIINIIEGGRKVFCVVFSSYMNEPAGSVTLNIIETNATQTTSRKQNIIDLSNSSPVTIDQNMLAGYDRSVVVVKTTAPFNGLPKVKQLYGPNEIYEFYTDPNLLTPANMPVESGTPVYFKLYDTSTLRLQWVSSLEFLHLSSNSLTGGNNPITVDKVNKKITITSNYGNPSANLSCTLPPQTIMKENTTNNIYSGSANLFVYYTTTVTLYDIFGSSVDWTIEVQPAMIRSNDVSLDFNFSPEKQLSKSRVGDNFYFTLMWQQNYYYSFNYQIHPYASIAPLGPIYVEKDDTPTDITNTSITVTAEDGTEKTYPVQITVNVPDMGTWFNNAIEVTEGQQNIDLKSTPLDLYYKYVNTSGGKQLVKFSLDKGYVNLEYFINDTYNGKYGYLSAGNDLMLVLNDQETLYYYLTYVSLDLYPNLQYTISVSNTIPSDKALINFVAGDDYSGNYPVTIKRISKEIQIEVPAGTSEIWSYDPEISAGARYEVTPNNSYISNNDILRIIALDGSHEDWTIKFEKVPLNTAANFEWYSIPGEVASAYIDVNKSEVWVFHQNGLNEKVIPSFRISKGAAISLNGQHQISGVSIVDLQDITELNYTITSESGIDKSWTVKLVNVATNSPDILTFDLHGQSDRPLIDRTNNTISTKVWGYVSLSQIPTYFTTTTGASVKVADNPVSNGGVVNYTGGSKTLLLTEGAKTKSYTIHITQVAKPCKAAFGYTVTGNTVTFTNQSEGAAIFLWEFGDGTTSKDKDPQHVYAKGGKYTVTLTVVDKSGQCIDNAVQTLFIGTALCKSAFSYSVNNATRTVTFTNESTGALYLWYFGDGSYSTDANPVHTYPKDGSYKVSLIAVSAAANCKDYSEQTIVVGENTCDATFSFLIDESSITSKNISFQASSNPDYLHTWIFPDGTVSTDPNPVVVFDKRFLGKVTHTIFNTATNCSDSYETIIRFGFTSDDCEADFFSLPNDLTVSFTANPIGNTEKYLWNFGDGVLSTDANPVHTYNSAGIYHVCLSVVNDKGVSDITCKKVVAGSSEEICIANYDYVVQPSTRDVIFADKSLGSPSQWVWDFGDNSQTSGVPGAIHRYAANDYYLTSLGISNNNCTAKAYKLINVGMPNQLKVMFAYELSSDATKAGGYPVDFIGAGLGDEARIKWDFGDGTTDTTTTNPTHVYAKPGTYTVCYEVTDPITQVTDKYCQQILVTSVEIAALADGLEVYPNPVTSVLNVAFNAAISETYTFTLTDLSGRVVKSMMYQATAGNNQLRWNAEDLKSGTYLLQVKTGRNAYNMLIIKK